MYFISTHSKTVNSVTTQINTVILDVKWNSKHIKGSSKKISKSKAIKDNAKVKNCKEYVTFAELDSKPHSNIVNSVESIL